MTPEQVKMLVDSSLPMFFDDGIEAFIEWRGKVVRYMADIVNQAIAEAIQAERTRIMDGIEQTSVTAPVCNCFLHKRGELTAGWICPAHGNQL